MYSINRDLEVIAKIRSSRKLSDIRYIYAKNKNNLMAKILVKSQLRGKLVRTGLCNFLKINANQTFKSLILSHEFE